MSDEDAATDEHTPLIRPDETRGPCQPEATASRTTNEAQPDDPGRGVLTEISLQSSSGVCGHPLPSKSTHQNNLHIFRRSLGINSDLLSSGASVTAEARRLKAFGVYQDVLNRQRAKRRQGAFLSALIYAACLAEIIISAVLTALGPMAGNHTASITVLGAVNTVVAGVLALIEGQNLLDTLRSEEMELRRLRCWIEETEALLAVGEVGRDAAETRDLIRTALKKYKSVRTGDGYDRSLVSEAGGSDDMGIGARLYMVPSA
jgi:hypothetical protein